MKSVAIICALATGLCINAACERSCLSETDKSLAGMIVSRGNTCHCFIDETEIQPWYELTFDVAKDVNDMLIIDVYGETPEKPKCFPPGGPVWNICSGPFSVQGNNKTVDFNDNIGLTLKSMNKDGAGSFDTVNAKIEGWITNSSSPVTRATHDICLQFEIYISWTKDEEKHLIRITDSYGEV